MKEVAVVKEVDRLLKIYDSEDFLLKEAKLEEEYMYCIQELDKDVVVTDIGKAESRSIGLQINSWIKSLNEQERDSTLTLQNSLERYEDFKEYMTNKYSGKKKKEWEEKLANPDFKEDTLRLMRSRIYEHKAKRTRKGVQMFISPNAHYLYQQMELSKEIRKSQHESLNRVLKVMESNEDERLKYLSENKELLVQSMKEAYEHVIKDLMPDLLPNRENKIDTYLQSQRLVE